MKTIKKHGVAVKIQHHENYDDIWISGEERKVNYVVEQLNAIDYQQRFLPWRFR